MSGPENIRGIDYQVSYSLLRVLEAIRDEPGYVKSFKFESLFEGEEDLNIIRRDGGREYIQIKKRAEGYNWTPSDVKGVLEKFNDKDRDDVSFTFVTNAGGNVTVRDLKLALLTGGPVNDDILHPFETDSLTISTLRTLLSKTTILTHTYTSNVDEDPASVIRDRIHQMLLRSPFYIRRTVEEIYDGLWKFIFDSARSGSEIELEEILGILPSFGVELTRMKWINIPNIDAFSGREEELVELSGRLRTHHVVLVQGISGVGKTLLLGKLAQDMVSSQKNVCWIGLSPLTTSAEILSTVVACLCDIGFERESEYLALAEEAQRESRFIDILKRTELYVFFDSVDSGSHDVSKFVETLMFSALREQLVGGMVLSSTMLPVDPSPLLNARTTVYELGGFTQDDTELILSDSNVSFSEEQLAKFHEAVGGHPMSLVFLKQLLDDRAVSDVDIDELESESVENTRQWIFRKVYLELDPSEQSLLLTASVFNYPFMDREIEPLIESPVKPRYIMDGLIRKSIVTVNSSGYLVHDSVRPLVYNMLNDRARRGLHDKLAEFYKGEIEKLVSDFGGAPYGLTFRWGYHVEHIGQADGVPLTQRTILELEADYLDALWAVLRFGYPFAYSDPELSSAERAIHYLEDKGLISENQDPMVKYGSKVKLYVASGLDFYDRALVVYLCMSRGISRDLGYIERFEVNHAFEKQGLICHWEHCIEHMPLPGVTRAEHAAHLDFLKEQLESGVYDSEPPEVRERLEQQLLQGIPPYAPEEIDPDLLRSKCPVFGHCCPGGEEQATLCRTALQD